MDKKKSKLIKVGWNRLTEEKKREYAKLGIRGLDRTPGKLITKKGHIDGYLSAFGIPWGKISFTPEQAEKATGFRSKEGSTGIVISRRRYVDENGKVKFGLFATSLTSRKTYIPKSKLRSRIFITALSKIVSNHLRDIIHPIWEPLVVDKNRAPWSGAHYFISLNGRNIGTGLDWSKLQISKGDMRAPGRALWNWYDEERRQIHIDVPITIRRRPVSVNQVGIGIFDIKTGEFFHISPEQLREHLMEISPYAGLPGNHYHPSPWEGKSWEIKWCPQEIKNYLCVEQGRSERKSRFYAYFYYMKGACYSSSVCSRIIVGKRMPRKSAFHVIVSIK